MLDQGEGAGGRETRRGDILPSVRKFNALVDFVSGVSVERDFTRVGEFQRSAIG